MIIPRQGHACVSITTAQGQKMLAVGGIDQDNQPISDVELFDTTTKTWTVDGKRSVQFPTEK